MGAVWTLKDGIIGTPYHPVSIPTRKVDPIYYRILESIVNR